VRARRRQPQRADILESRRGGTQRYICLSYALPPTQWQRLLGCLISVGYFPQKSPIISGSFAECESRDKTSYGSWPPCIVGCYQRQLAFQLTITKRVQQKSPIISDQFAESDPRDKTCCGTWRPCRHLEIRQWACYWIDDYQKSGATVRCIHQLATRWPRRIACLQLQLKALPATKPLIIGMFAEHDLWR